MKMNKGAIISADGKYRFKLWRIWDETKPLVLFIMHNPSKADGTEDDPTINRCIGFAQSWACGGIYVGNLSPYRATNPKDLLTPDVELFPIENIDHIQQMERLCKIKIMAYGNASIQLRSVLWIFDKKQYQYLKLTKQGNPWHPLYLPANLTPKSF